MKRRHYIATFEADDIQKQIEQVKHERARELLESRLISTYLESYINLDTNEALILCMKDYVSDNILEQIKEMVNSIMTDYPQIKKVDVFGRTAFWQEFKMKGKPFPKSSIIQLEMEGEKDELPSLVINGVQPELCGKETLAEADTLQELKDKVILKMGGDPTYQVGDEEAGEIRIVTETIDTIKNKTLEN